MHPLMITFPLGLLSTAVLLDIFYLITGSEGATVLSFWMIALGIIFGLLAAIPGLIDWVAIIPANTRAKSVGLLHGIGNVVVLVLFAGSWYLRRDAEPGFRMAGRPETFALILSFAGFVLALGTGWLGGELIERLGIAVYDGAHPNAPNTLSGRPATDSSDSVI
jgi:uncharacterized membrane protein